MRKIFSLVLAMCVSISCFAGVAKALHLEEMMPSVVQPVLGNHADTLEDVFDGETHESSAVLSDYQVTNDGEVLQIQGKITTAEGNAHHFNVGGNLHEFVNGENKTVYLAEIEDTVSLHFVQARIDSENSACLKLLVQDKANEEFMYFEVPVSNVVIPQVYALNSTTVGDSEVAKRLYNVAENIISPNNSEMTVTVSENGDAEVIITENGVQLPQSRATYNTTSLLDNWKGFFTTIMNGSSAYLSTYSLDTRILNTGWTFLHNTSASVEKYALSCYTSQNGTGSKMVNLFLIEVIDNFGSRTSALTLKEVRHITLEYNSSNQKFSLYMANDSNVEVYQIDMRMNIVSNSAYNDSVFIVEDVDINLPNNGRSLTDFVAYIPYASFGVDVWNYLTSETTTDMDYIHDYYDSYERQVDAYEGEVVRGIGFNAGNNSFEAGRIPTASDYYYTRLAGTIDNWRSGCATWTYGFTGRLR